MNDRIECMCLKCGISSYLDGGDVALAEDPYSGPQMLRDRFCECCGGALMVRGKADDEPHYRVTV